MIVVFLHFLLINSKEPDSIHERHFSNQVWYEGKKVQCECADIVPTIMCAQQKPKHYKHGQKPLSILACVQDDGEGGEELASGCELLAFIDLLPECQIGVLILIRIKGRPH